jgi:hypothetical protein
MDQKQKKQLAIAVGLVVVAGLLLYFLMFAGKGGNKEAAAQIEGDRVPFIALPPAPATPAAAPAPAAPAAPGAPAAPKPLLYRADPFRPLVEPKDGQRVEASQPPLSTQLGMPAVAVKRVVGGGPLLAAPPGGRPGFISRSTKRLIGLMFDGRAWAILEVDGRSTVLKPGDTFDGGKVQSIGRESVTIVGEDQKEEVLTLAGTPSSAEALAPLEAAPPVSLAPAFPLPAAPSAPAPEPGAAGFRIRF